eukprot:COSAG06_NODE_9010_length_2012_cov_2.035546_2_plen_136_part_00
MVGVSSVDFRRATEQLLKNSPRHVLGPDRDEDGGQLGARGHAQRRIRRLSTKQQQLALVNCHRRTVQRKLREDDTPIGTLGLPHEQLAARRQPPQGRGVARRRRPPLRILTASRSDFGAMHAVVIRGRAMIHTYV